MRGKALAVVPLLVLIACAALTAWEPVSRSTIPRHLDGAVSEVQRRTEDNPGKDDAWFVRVGTTTVRMDQAVAERLQDGDRIRKESWSRTLYVNGDPTRIALSRDARGALWFAPVLVLLGSALSWLVRRRKVPGPQP